MTVGRTCLLLISSLECVLSLWPARASLSCLVIGATARFPHSAVIAPCLSFRENKPGALCTRRGGEHLLVRKVCIFCPLLCFFSHLFMSVWTHVYLFCTRLFMFCSDCPSFHVWEYLDARRLVLPHSVLHSFVSVNLPGLCSGIQLVLGNSLLLSGLAFRICGSGQGLAQFWARALPCPPRVLHSGHWSPALPLICVWFPSCSWVLSCSPKTHGDFCRPWSISFKLLLL